MLNPFLTFPGSIMAVLTRKWPYLYSRWADLNSFWVDFKVLGDSKLPFVILNISEIDSTYSIYLKKHTEKNAETSQAIL